MNDKNSRYRIAKPLGPTLAELVNGVDPHVMSARSLAALRGVSLNVAAVALAYARGKSPRKPQPDAGHVAQRPACL